MFYHSNTSMNNSIKYYEFSKMNYTNYENYTNINNHYNNNINNFVEQKNKLYVKPIIKKNETTNEFSPKMKKNVKWNEYSFVGETFSKEDYDRTINKEEIRNNMTNKPSIAIELQNSVENFIPMRRQQSFYFNKQKM